MQNLILLLVVSTFVFLLLDNELRRISNSYLIRISASYLVIVSSLIYTASFLSCLNLLNHKIAYVVVFVFMIFIFCGALRLLKYTPVKTIIKVKRSGYSLLTRFFILFFILISIGSFYIAINSFPEHGDSTSYKLPRLYYYIANGNLLPRLFHDGPRVYGPLNGALIQLPVVLFNLPVSSFYVLNFFHWLMLGLALYSVSYLVTEKSEASILSVIFFLVSGVTLYQGASDGDDLLSSVPAVFGVLFFILWVKERQGLFAYFAGIGIGISFGAKFFPVFYFPIFILFLVYILIKKQYSFFNLRQIRHYFVFGVSFLSVTLTFFVASFISFGSISYPDYNSSYLLNLPLSFSLGFHNLIVHNTSLVFSFIPELFPTDNPHAWKIIHDTIQKLFESNLWPVLNEGWMVNSVKRSLSWDGFYTNKEFFGTFGFLIFLNITFLSSLKKRFSDSFFWLVILFLIWNITYSFVHKYLADCGRYWILPVSLCVPLVSGGIDEFLLRKNRFQIKQILLLLSIIPIFPLAWMQLNTDYHRNIVRFLVSEVDYRRIYKFPYDKELSELKSLNILRSYYNFPFFEILRHTQNLRHITISGNIIPEVENVIMVNSNYIKNPDTGAYPIFLPFRMDPSLGGTFRFCYERYAGYLFVHTNRKTSCDTNGSWEIFSGSSQVLQNKLSLKLWNDYSKEKNIKIAIQGIKNSNIHYSTPFLSYSYGINFDNIPLDLDFLLIKLDRDGHLSSLKYPMNSTDRFFLQDVQ